MDIPVLETERLILRAITPDDRYAIFQNYSDPEVANWFFDQPYTQVEQADQIIQVFTDKAAEGKGLAWAILLKESGQFIGTCSYEDLTGLQGEIGFDLARQHWGHGYMSEATQKIIHYGFTVLQLVRIEAHTYSRNSRARKMLDRLGFKVEAISQETHFYGLTKEDWMQTHIV